MGTRHNLYWMLHLPPEVAQAIVLLQRRLNTSYRGPSKPMAADRLHTTLVPLGSYKHRIRPEVLRMVHSAGALVDEAPFRVCFDTLQSRTRGAISALSSWRGEGLVCNRCSACDGNWSTP